MKDVTAAILCGGKSKRMGFDKAFLMEEEHYLLLETARNLKSLFEHVVLVSDTKSKFAGVKGFEEFGILEDGYIQKGPIGGVSTALEQIQTDYAFVMACDMPLMNLDLIDRMYRKLGQKQVLLCSHGEKLEPLFAFYHRSCIPVFKEQIEKGELKLRSAFSRLQVGTYCLSEAEISAITNLNTPEDVEKWNTNILKNK
ncbi:MAG: molybdenum cofactor guanylyltransferase [Lacrimispora sp.]|uniref:molybdenum cofactor guanylyltransferase n=1 Tax=Lacrimispora sp. TaxID=2719234 RepID=UPI0039E591F2